MKKYKFEAILKLKEEQKKLMQLELIRAKEELNKQKAKYQNLVEQQRNLTSLIVNKQQEFLMQHNYFQSLYAIELSKYIAHLKSLKKEKQLALKIEKEKLSQTQEEVLKKQRGFFQAYQEMKIFLMHQQKYINYLKSQFIKKENKEISELSVHIIYDK